VASRLLDWTDGGLTALYFGVRDKSRIPESGSVVYVLDPYWLIDHLDSLEDYKQAKKNWNSYRAKYPDQTRECSADDWEKAYVPDYEQHRKHLVLPDVPLLWDAPHVSRRIAAQRSRFMIFGRDFDWLARLFADRNSHLYAITIPRDAINKVKQQLRDAGMAESVLFPDLDGLGREIAQAFEARR
jgi:hypothetical protein